LAAISWGSLRGNARDHKRVLGIGRLEPWGRPDSAQVRFTVNAFAASLAAAVFVVESFAY